ncbi:transglutaminase family protein [Neptuniibacter halophilus]|uniref:transglutaminase family protein n=1 Tax=Neptuniibacter halophilus TaxID=651666 RepID=UPI002573F165|nr:transglutaminase family protein [Neptuniibacter halophilus]
MIYRIRHITEYDYHSPVSLCINQAHVLPRNTTEQRCRHSDIRITPRPEYLAEREDYFGNRYCYFAVEREHQKLVIDVTTEIETSAQNANRNLDLGNTCAQAKKLLADARSAECIAAREFILDSPMVQACDALREFTRGIFNEDRPLLSAVRELCHKIHHEFTYEPLSTNTTTSLEEVLQNRRGVCQDFAHLAIGCIRAQGFPARYVSGYLETLPPPGKEKLIGADASHAWLAIYSPGEGWFDFDPTNNNMPDEQHITTAWGRDYGDVTPVKGVIFADDASQELKVSVNVERLTG